MRDWYTQTDRIKYQTEDISKLITLIFELENRICIYIQKEKINGELDNLYGLQFDNKQDLIEYGKSFIDNTRNIIHGDKYITIETKDNYRFNFIISSQIKQLLLPLLNHSK